MNNTIQKTESKNIFFAFPLVWEIILMLVVLSLRFLCHRNMGSSFVNEGDVLPLARQYFDSSWMPQDWYLNQPAGYRLLFQTLIGWLTVNFGFLGASIIGRLVCYSLVATGLVLIGKRLRLSLPYLLLAIILFTYPYEISHQGAIAKEWLVGGLEAKAIAYGFILIAIAFFLAGRYLITALLLGCATSFHVLVGGWAFLTCLGWFLLRPRQRLPQINQNILLLLFAYTTTSIFAISPVWQQLMTQTPINPELPSPSFIYVFLRLSHHLNPLSWKAQSWIKVIVYLLILLGNMVLLKNRTKPNKFQNSRQILGELALVSLIPFLLGISITAFDSQGQWLQYYPFRFGDIMLPLTTFLLLACSLQDVFLSRKYQIKSIACIGIIALFIGLQGIAFAENLSKLQHFPSKQQGVSWQWKDMSNWIKQNTDKNAVIISSPAELPNFTWITERSTIVKLKLFSQNKTQIIEQYKRLDDLSGNHSFSHYLNSGNLNRKKTRKILADGYNSLTTSQAKDLMTKYHASYFLTRIKHNLDLEVAHLQEPYILYFNPIS